MQPEKSLQAQALRGRGTTGHWARARKGPWGPCVGGDAEGWPSHPRLQAEWAILAGHSSLGRSPLLDENCCLGGNQQGGPDCAPRFPRAGGLLLLHLLLSRRGRRGAQSPPPPSSILYQVKHFQVLVRQSGFILPSCGQTPVAVSHSELTTQQRVTTSSPLTKRPLGHSRGVCTSKAAPCCRALTG